MHPADVHQISSRRWPLVVVASALLAVPLSAQTNSNAVLDATKGSVTILHAATLDVAPRVTLEAWVKPFPPTHAFGTVIDKDYPYAFALGVASIPGRTDSVEVRLVLAGSHVVGPRVASNSITWTHLAATVDTSSHQVVFYVNGTPVKTFVDPSVRFENNTQSLRIGRSALGDVYRGMCDEIRVWNTVRTAPEIAALWNHEAKGNEPGLVAVYHFEDVRDTVAWNRAAGGDLHGTFSGSRLIVLEERPDVFIDENEPNNCYAAATPVNFDSFLQTATIAPADTDYFKIWTGAGDVFRINSAAKNAGEPADLKISIISVDSTLHITSHSGGYPSFYSAASVTGYRYIRVVNRGSTAASYTLKPVYWGETFVADEHEPNNSLALARPRPWGVTSYGTIFPGVDAGVAVRDSDYYAYTGKAGEIALFINTLQGIGCGSGTTSLCNESGQLSNTFQTRNLNYRFPVDGTCYMKIVPNEATYRYYFGGFKVLADIHDRLYDMITVGSGTVLRAGSNNPYTNAYILKINGSSFSAPPDYTATELDGRQIVFGPATTSGLSVTRKFFVPTAAQGDTLGWVRVQDVLTNTSGVPVTVNLAVTSTLGVNHKRVIASSTGDTLFTTLDTWLWTDDDFPSSGTPHLMHIIDGIGGRDRIDSVYFSGSQLYWEWSDVTVQPGETKIYLYYHSQDSTALTAQPKGPAFSTLPLPAAATLGLGGTGALVMNWATDALVSAETVNPVPMTSALEQNYPNPFNPVTTVRYQLAETGNLRLVVYDVLGREIAVLADETKKPGIYEVQFDGSWLASGVYFYRMQAGNFVETKSLLLLR